MLLFALRAFRLLDSRSTLNFCRPMDADSKAKPLHENLDTTFVNLWSLLRSLTQKGFIGRVHVESTDYSADVFMNGSAAPLVHEVDRASGTESFEEAALHRLVLRAREHPGKISVFEGADEAASVPTALRPSAPPAETAAAMNQPSASAAIPAESFTEDQTPKIRASTAAEPASVRDEVRPSETLSDDFYPAGSYNDWPAILKATGELIGGIENGINASGADFAVLFQAARVEFADDYSFLDPFSQTFVYENGVATLSHELPVKTFSSALGQVLRLTIDRAAAGERERRIRERVALEMLAVARKHRDVLERCGFQDQLDRIAGTRVM